MILVPHSAGESPLREFNQCHSPENGRFCSMEGGGSGSSEYHLGREIKRQGGNLGHGEGYAIIFKREADSVYRGAPSSEIARYLDRFQLIKFTGSPVRLVFDPLRYTAALGAPVKWTAPNGVTVVYHRSDRRSAGADGRGGAVYHDFNAGAEFVVPLSRHLGASRRALRAWVGQFLTSKITARFQARQLVRPGD